MALVPGTRLGVYEIRSLAGMGGMGEVYRARDTKLDREVAIKILPEAFATDADRVARFEREARTLAALNHPHIAQIYGLAGDGHAPALIMELVDGPTLADRIARGAVPSDEALPIARQICDALEAAHEAGIVHRDLKPANVKLRPDGTVKVLDFGLAKALADEPAGSAVRDLSHSPTITSPAATRVGVLLGTAAYMSPEQARGRSVDKRADIWAFGAVLYEMLTGKRAFDGEDISLTLAAVMKSEPDWNALPADISPSAQLLLKRCLQKDPKLRLRDIGDARLALEGAFDSPSPPVAMVGPSAATTSRARRAMPWIAGLLASVATGLAVWMVRAEPSAPVSRFEMALPNLSRFNGPNFTLSPDGASLVYAEVNALGQSRLMRRERTKLQADPIPGSEGAETAPFFSPDGAWIGFVTGGGRAIGKVPAAGGAATILCQMETSIFTPTWQRDNTILFGTPSGLWRVAPTGGPPAEVVKTERAAGGQQALPEGRGTIFHVNGVNQTEGSIEVLLPSGERRTVVQGMNPQYVPTGHLLFARLGGSLWAAPFDLERLAITRDPVPLPESVFRRAVGPSELAFAADGSFVYLPGSSGVGFSPVWVDRTGAVKPAFPDPGRYAFPRLSPDGRRVAIADAGDIWVVDLDRLTRTRLSYGDRGPALGHTAWTPDGRHVTFGQSNRDPGKPVTTLVNRRADASEAPQELFVADGQLAPGSWSADGNLIFAARPGSLGSNENWDLWVLQPGAKQPPARFVGGPFDQRSPSFSPDGRSVAYVSNESGRDQIYVSPFPGPGDRHTVSNAGGTEPVWSRNGRELFYRSGETMMVVKVTASPTLAFGPPARLFTGAFARIPTPVAPTYDVARDGSAFLMLQTPGAPSSQAVVVLNWFEELKRLVP